MSIANDFENSILNHLLKGTPLAQPTAITIGLSTADPGEAGAGLAEPSGNNYARVSSGSWNAASGGTATNAAEIAFAAASGSWGTVTHFAVFFDDVFFGSGALTASKAIESGDVARFAAGQLSLSMD